VAQDTEVVSGTQLGEENSQTLLADIDSLIDHTVQIYELTAKEGDVIAAIGSSVAVLLSALKSSLSLSQKIFQDNLPGIKTAIINNKAEIIIMQANGNIITKKFSDLDSKQVIEIMTEIIPKLNRNADATKVQITERMGMLKKMAKQFQRVKGVIGPDNTHGEEGTD
jgi:gas vesicle protein